MLTLPFQVMAKPRGPVCNLNCEHCYYLVKERLYPGADFRMSDVLLERYTHDYLTACPGSEVTFIWQGGEPMLMGREFFEHAIALQRKHARPGVRVRNNLQTNGVLLDRDWCRFFHEHQFLIGISIDGPDRCHDAYRVSPRGRPSLDRALRGVQHLQTERVSFNVLACVHQANVHRPLDVYRFLRDRVGAEFIQFIPVVTRDNELRGQQGARLIPQSTGSRAFGEFMVAVFDEWVSRDVGRVFVQMFDATLASYCGQNPGVCVFQPTCGRAMLLEFCGDLYACDHFVEPRYRLGNILETPLEQLVGSLQQRQFGRDKRDRLPRKCHECDYRFACQGGCPKDRLVALAADEPPLNYLCDGYTLYYSHVDEAMRWMAGALRAGRPPATIMDHLAGRRGKGASAEVRVGRNSPCPCGSGRKFKHCHGRS
jgi:uncharacterized protein